MKPLIVIIVCIQMTLSATLCGQENKHVPLDFVRSMWNVSANTKGEIRGETRYKNIGNKAGSARVYMIHKNGGDWWYKDIKRKFPKHVEDSIQMFAKDYAIERLLKQDSIFLKDYNKWAFFIDKKELKGEKASSGEKGLTVIDYYPKYPHTVILYEQKVGSTHWIEIDRKIFPTEDEENRSTWESDFINQKLKESNAHGPRK